MSWPISRRDVRQLRKPTEHRVRRARNARDHAGASPPSSSMCTPLVYSSSGRFHGFIQKSKASLSTRIVIACGADRGGAGGADGNCEKAAPSGTAIASSAAKLRECTTDIGYTRALEASG